MKKTFYEFFAGGGMAHAGLGRDWECLFANDFSEKKQLLTQQTGVIVHFTWGTWL